MDHEDEGRSKRLHWRGVVCHQHEVREWHGSKALGTGGLINSGGASVRDRRLSDTE